VTVTLRPITKENWRSVYRLTRTLTDEQQQLVAANGYSMLEAIYEPEEFTGYAIYADETVVGFLMTSSGETEPRYWIVRLMIGGEYQGKGYGRAALLLGIDLLKAKPGCDSVYISFMPENQVARALYESVGFIDTGMIEDEELVFRLPLTRNEMSE
jgi:diamine N-acetyltransferase